MYFFIYWFVLFTVYLLVISLLLLFVIINLLLLIYSFRIRERVGKKIIIICNVYLDDV